MEKTSKHGLPLSDATRDRLRALVDRIGEYAAAEKIGVGCPTVARALAGLGVRRASATAIAARLDVIEASAPSVTTR